jgi:hypothetical protein
MKTTFASHIVSPCTAADQNAKRALASLLKSQSASRMAEGNPPLLESSAPATFNIREKTT